MKTYYGSEYLCIRRTFAEEMLSAGDYNKEIQDWLSQGLENGTEDQKFVVLPFPVKGTDGMTGKSKAVQE